MVNPIFKDEHHQQLFNKQGFIVLPFLNTDEVQLLDNFFDELHPNLGNAGFFSGTYSKDTTYKKLASEKIVSVFSRVYEETFINYTPFGGAFLYKVPGHDSALAVHQDWTIVDETKNVALNCWVPLCDVTIENGPLMVLPGSQFDALNVVRSPTLPFFFSGDDNIVMEQLIPMEVKAGTAVILNQSVIHYSPTNKSNKVRKAITAGVKTKDAQMYFHYKIPDKDELEVFEVPDSFFLNFNDFLNDIGKRPYWGGSIGVMQYKLPELRGEMLKEKLLKMILDAGYQPNLANKPLTYNIATNKPSIFKRIANIFS